MYLFTTVFGTRKESDLKRYARAALPRLAVPQRTGIDAALRALREGREWGRGRGDK